jgi:hypothetical protein
VAQQGKDAPPERLYYLGDALGSVRQLTDESGAVTLTKNYTPYGETGTTSGAAATPFGFTGEWTVRRLGGQHPGVVRGGGTLSLNYGRNACNCAGVGERH